jgi:hypothetical protein
MEAKMKKYLADHKPSRHFMPLLFCVAVLLTGCMSKVPAKATLCLTQTNSDVWKDGKTHLQIDESGQKYTFDISIEELTDGQYTIERPGYWVMISGFTWGAAAGEPSRPMMYDLKDTWVEVSGEKHYATSILLGRHGISELPVDLNSRALHPNGTTTPITVGFPLARPDIKQNWVVHMGQIRLGDEIVSLPEFHSCYHPAFWERRRILPDC